MTNSQTQDVKVNYFTQVRNNAGAKKFCVWRRFIQNACNLNELNMKSIDTQ